MKTIINKKGETFTPLEQINNGSIVGIDFKKDGGKAIVILDKEGYIGKYPHNTTFEIDCEWAAKTKNKYVEDCLKMKAEAYVFDTIGELMQWCLEK